MGKEINISVDNLIPTLQEGCKSIVCDNGDYTVNFLFDEEWAEHRTKTALFVCGGRTYDSVFEGDICEVPEIKDGTICYIGVVSGKLDEENAHPKKKTSIWCEVEAVPSITSIASEPQSPDPDVYVEFMALLNKYIAGGGGGGDVEFAVDQHYYPTSSRAQSGKAVREAIVPIEESIERIEGEIEEQQSDIEKLLPISDELQEVKETVRSHGENIEYAVSASLEAKTVANALKATVSSLVTDSTETRTLLWEETQRAMRAENELENSKQDNLVFDGTYNEQSNRVATVGTVAREVARIVANAPADFDTLKELADWLNDHSADATEMNSRISANTTAISQINNEQTAQNTKIEQNEQRIDNAFTSANNSLNIANTALEYSSEAKEISEIASAKVDRLEQNMQDIVVFDGDYNPETNKAATVSTVSTEVAKIVASAPEDFDTLKEIADYIASDKTGATEINNKLANHETRISANETAIGEISTALDELHNYAQSLVSGGES